MWPAESYVNMRRLPSGMVTSVRSATEIREGQHPIARLVDLG